MRVVHSLKMDLVRPWAGNLLNMVQGDSNTRVVELQLFSDGTEWEIPPVELVTVAFKKPDKHKGFYETEYTIDRNCIQVVLAPQVLTAYGKVTVVVELRNAEGSSLASFPFGIMVSQNPEVDAEASEDYFNYVNPFIMEALEKVEAAAKEANEAADRAEAALTTAETAAEEAAKAASDAQEAVTNAETAVQEASSAVDRANKAADETLEAKDSFLEAAENALTEIRGVVDSGTEAPAIVSSKVGSVIALNDSSDLLLKGLNLFGKTTQFTTTGKNLLPKNPNVSVTNNGVTYTTNKDGSVTISGKANGASFFIINSITLEAGKSYILSGCPSGGDTNGYAVYIANTSFFDRGSGATFTADGSNYSVVIMIPDGYVANNPIFYPMIRLASVTDATYEPYTGGKASPSPDYPQELESVGADGNVAVTVCGGNLINIPDGVNYSTSGITFSANKGIISVTGKNTSADGVISTLGTAMSYKLPIGAKGTFYFSCDCVNVEAYVYKRNADGSTKYIINKSFVMDGTERSATVYFQVRGGVTTNENLMPMLNCGSVPLPFEPYKGQTLTAQTPNGLPGIPVSSGGNYIDENGQMWVCDEIDFARGKYVQRVFLETIQFQAQDLGNGIRYVGTATNNISPNHLGSVVCKTLPYHRDATVGLNGIRSAISTERDIIAYYNGEVIESAELLYPLASPIETDLTAEELAQYSVLHTNYPNTTIYNDEGAGLGVKYVADTKMYIDNKFAELAAAIVNNT